MADIVPILALAAVFIYGVYMVTKIVLKSKAKKEAEEDYADRGEYDAEDDD